MGEAAIAITIGIVMMGDVVVDVILVPDRLLVLIAAATEGTVVGIEIEIEIEIGMTTDTGTEIIAGLLRKEATTILEDIDMTYHPNTTLLLAAPCSAYPPFHYKGLPWTPRY